MKLLKIVSCVLALVLALLAIYFACVFFYRQLIVFALFVVFLALRLAKGPGDHIAPPAFEN